MMGSRNREPRFPRMGFSVRLGSLGLRILGGVLVALLGASAWLLSCGPEDRSNPLDPAAAPTTDPFGLSVRLDGGTVVLVWTAPDVSGITAYRIYRRDLDTDDAPEILATVGSDETLYRDRSILPAHRYEYRIRALDRQERESAESLVVPVQVSTNPILEIAGGATETTRRLVPLRIVSAPTPSMRLGNDPDLSTRPFEPFAPEIPSWTLEGGPGSKQVYLQVLFAEGDTSGVVSASIDALPVTDALIVLQGGAETLCGETADILLRATSADSVRLAQSEADLDGAEFFPISGEATLEDWPMGPTPGVREVWAEFRNDFDSQRVLDRIEVFLPLDAPAEVSAQPGCGRIEVRWSPVEGARSYRVYRDQEDEPESATASPWTDSRPGREAHVYRVSAIGSCGEGALSPASDAATAAYAPDAPAGVAAEPGCSEITIGWNPVPGALRYFVYRDGLRQPGPVTSPWVDAAPGNAIHRYEVSAENACGEGPRSSPTSAQVSGLPPIPSGLIATAGCNAIELRWNPLSGALRYRVHRDGNVVAEVLAPEWTDESPGEGVRIYRVSAESTCGEGAPGPPATASALFPPDRGLLTVATPECGAIELIWDAVAEADSYRVERDGIVQATVTETRWKDTNPGDSSHSYEVRAANRCGVGPVGESAVAAALLVPGSPDTLTASPDCGLIRLSWSAVEGAASYEIERDGVPLATSSLTEWTDADPGEGLHAYAVRGVNSCGRGAPSPEATAAPVGLLPAPPAPTGTPECGRIVLSWSAVSGAESYGIYRDGFLLATVTALTYADSNPGASAHTYRVTASNACGEGPRSDPSETLQALPSPAVPTGLAAEAECGQIRVQWDPVADVNAYRVYRDGSLLVTVDVTEYVDADPGASPRIYEVTAFIPDNPGACQESAPAGPTDALSALAAPAAPAAPSVDADCGEITVSWAAVAGATGYGVYRDGSGIRSATVSAPSWTDTSPGTSPHTYRVTAENACGESGQSAPSNAVQAPSAPGMPVGVIATPHCGAITVTWSAVATATSYQIYRDGSGTPSAEVTVTEWEDPSPGTATHTYRVAGRNACGGGPLSASTTPVQALAVPGTPTGVSAAAGCGQITVSWNSVSGATSYRIYRDDVLLGGDTAPPFTDNTPGGSPHTYRVSAVGDCGEGNRSSPTSAVTALGVPGTPAGVSASPGCGQISVTWSTVSGATSYRIYRDGGFLGSDTASPFTDTSPGSANHNYQVSAVGTCGEGTLSTPTSSVAALPIPDVPTGEDAAGGCGMITVTWDAVAGATSYRVFRDGTFLAVVDASPYEDLNPGTSIRTYQISAVQGACESSPSAATAGVRAEAPLAAPSGLTATPACEAIDLTWAALDGATAYQVFRDGSGTPSAEVTDPAWTDPDPGVDPHTYQVAGVNLCGTGALSTPSPPVLAEVGPDPPGTIIALSGCGQISVYWPMVPEAIDYVIYKDGSEVPYATSWSAPFVDTDDVLGFHNYQIAAVDSCTAGPRSDSSNEATGEDCGGAPTDLIWDFSLGDQGFTTGPCDGLGGDSVWQFGTEDNVGGESFVGWATVIEGNYFPNSGDALESPTFTVTEERDVLEIRHWYSTEPTWDGGNLRVNGDLIVPITGYDSAISPPGDYYAYCVDGQVGWHGGSAGWVTEVFDLSAYQGQDVRIQIQFGSDIANQLEGWYIAYLRVKGAF